MSDWKRVADREPGVDEHVLFWRRGWECPQVGHRGVHQQFFVHGLSRKLLRDPTHWIPLPDLPPPPPPPPPPLTWAAIADVEPHDGEQVLLWSGEWVGTIVGLRSPSGYRGSGSVLLHPPPTHWMSFPDEGPATRMDDE